jgi:hypothetical protein
VIGHTGYIVYHLVLRVPVFRRQEITPVIEIAVECADDPAGIFRIRLRGAIVIYPAVKEFVELAGSVSD